MTGANGYLGRGIIKRLADDGIEVIATDFSAEYIDDRVEIILGDIFSLENPYQYYKTPDVVLHMAWRNGFIHNDPSHIIDLPSHYRFIEKMVKSGVKRIALMGSMHEIGFYEGCIKADTPANPLSLYGISKNALRQSVQLICGNYNTKFQWIRGFYIVGNSRTGSSIFAKIVQAEENHEERFPFTNGLNQWDFIDYDEFCKQMAMIVEQDQYTGIINACSGRPEKLSDRVERFIKENHYQIKLAYGTFPDRPYDSKAVWGDDSIVKKIVAQSLIDDKSIISNIDK